jgi:hypothetical protein
MVRFRVYRAFHAFVRRRFPHLARFFIEPHDARWADGDGDGNGDGDGDDDDGEPEETLHLAGPQDRAACLNAENGVVRCPIAHSKLGAGSEVVINGTGVCFSARQLVEWVVRYGRRRDPYTRRRYSRASVQLLESLADRMPEDEGHQENDELDELDDD